MRASEAGVRLVGLPPLLDAETRVLVLGSFPGAASLAARQYYGHPRNQFWSVMGYVFQTFSNAIAHLYGLDSYQKVWLEVPQDYGQRCYWLRSAGVGLWDVYAACERRGSLDAHIRAAEPNDLGQLHLWCPRLKLVVHNGAESGKHARHTRGMLAQHGVSVVQLPSTSPAHASWSLARKQAAWAQALQPAWDPQSRSQD